MFGQLAHYSSRFNEIISSKQPESSYASSKRDKVMVDEKIDEMGVYTIFEIN